MHSRRLLRAAVLAFAAMCVFPAAASAQLDAPQATFKSSVDLVSVSAVVRDKKGKVIRSLTREDFVVTDDGQVRTILDLQADESSPASVALLVDGSGSMRLGDAIMSSQQICEIILYNLRKNQDLAALMSFDTRLLTLREFTSEFEQIHVGLGEVEAWGSTSIYDAIAGTAAVVAGKTQKRRAVVVITDGSDNASAYSPEEVAWIASTIDVPVYVFAVGGIGPVTPNEQTAMARRNPLFELARATGGEYFFASSPTLIKNATAKLLEELRHQYLIAFEPSPSSGLRRIEIRTRNADLKVRARKWYTSDSD